MSEHLEVEGEVTDVFAGGHFTVQTDEGAELRAQLSGRLRKNRIRVLLGDRVKIRISPYDLTHGQIVYRYR